MADVPFGLVPDTGPPPSDPEDDCRPCRRGNHRACREDPDLGVRCGCAEGGHA